ncbi:non-specific lipid-transfer protein 1-like [Prosopis cineraria]|uniref:non-specific lipid-transfer protein 1-like n=1 Tax=Prosopis cineraria TaxID=364024 RepID=UPI00240F05B4|nr:non-specific lipid-transfer protein 1-like [Prosopis cineraria]
MAGVMMKLACMAVMCAALVGAPLAEAITCGQVTTNVAPCLSYFQRGGTPSPSCCNGVKNLVGAARTTADKQTVCNCLKTIAAQVPGYNDANAQAIPAKCNVNVPYKISTSTNCASIKL